MTRSLRVLATLAFIAPAALAQSAPPAVASPATAPAATRLAEVWDLTPLFADDAAWEAERQALSREIPGLRELRGTLGRDAASLRSGLDRISAANRRLSRLWVYASMLTSTANAERRNQERSALMLSLWGEYRSALAWVDPELQAIGAPKLTAFQQAEPGLKPHAARLRQVLRQAPHTLTPEAEAALATMTPVLGSAGNTRSLLVNADMRWPRLSIDGREVEINDTGYTKWREHGDRNVRRQVFDAFWGAYGQYENTLGALLAQRVQAGVLEARLRKHPSAAAASVHGVELDEVPLRTLVAEVNKALPTFHRYLKLRQALLKLPDLGYHDIYPPMVSGGRPYGLDESAALTIASVAPLGADYQRQLTQAINARTMHVRPAPGKSGGAYQTGAYGFTPYVFLNHQDDFDSLVTFAHEWGHGMHTALANQAQPYETAGYPLFLAEIASMTNEVLLTEHLLKSARTRDERLFVLGQTLDRLRGSYFRQTMFAEFELAVHDAQQRGEPMSGKRFTQTYCDLLKKYHGESQGVMKIDPKVCVEWAFIPHFHRPFYVYQYATSAAAAQHFGERILAGQPGVREAYLDVLRAGGSVPPHELLLKAGLDMTSPAPHQRLVRAMETMMDEMESLLKQRR